ncbi:MAG: FHA domain-containing protein [Deltaproteobacteria bacterium]|nr:FHA domain-containing protein [Deltaproteobacteria bacterium]
MARLILATADGTQSVELRPTNTLGRHPNNSIQLLDKIVSKEHCIILLQDGQWILRDLGSLNGTYINSERVQGERPLRHGDEIALGSTRARFDDGSGAPMRPFAGAPGPGLAQPSGGSAPHMQAAVPQAGYQPGGSPTGQGIPGVYPMPPLPQGGQGGPGMGGGRIPSVPGLPVPPQGQGPVTAVSGAPVRPFGPAPQAVQPPQNLNITAGGSRMVEVQDQNRAIGTQIAAVQKGFGPFDQIAHDPQTVRDDYERLRIAYEVTRELVGERDIDTVIQKILAACFKFVRADRGVIFLMEDGNLVPRCNRRRSGGEAPVVVSSTILDHVKTNRTAVLTNDAAMDFASSKGKSMILNRISSAMVVPLIHNDTLLGVLWLDSEQLAVFNQKELELVTSLAHQASMFVENALLAKKVESEIVTRERFSRLLSPNLAQQVIAGKLDVKLGGSQLNECTVFNSDIRGFTRMSDGAQPQGIVDMLNEYFELMVEVLFKYEGTLDKFMGDGIMALFGAPVSHPDDPIRSVQTALEMMDVLGQLNRRRLSRGESALAIGIGIHTGPLVAGYVGSSKALSYTVIGDTANTSARLCGIAEAGQIVVSETTAARLGNRFDLAELPPAKLKGKERPLRCFDVKSERGVQRPAPAAGAATTAPTAP